jgi:hypothetical protein
MVKKLRYFEVGKVFRGRQGSLLLQYSIPYILDRCNIRKQCSLSIEDRIQVGYDTAGMTTLHERARYREVQVQKFDSSDVRMVGGMTKRLLTGND